MALLPSSLQIHRGQKNAPPVPDSQTVPNSLGGLEEGVNNSCILLHIYHQLYKTQQKPDPFSGSCRVQLVTRE